VAKAARWLWLLSAPAVVLPQAPRMPMPIQFEDSAEFRWLIKPVMESKVLDDMSHAKAWQVQGQANASWLAPTPPLKLAAVRIEMQMFRDQPPPSRNGLSAVSIKRSFPGEDWSSYNRISLWIRPELSGFPMLPLEIVLHNDGKEKVPDIYRREGIHYVTLQDRKWQHVVREVTPLARDKVTYLDINYWVNKRLPDPDDK
jgi:hypothetical protein